MIQVFSVRLTKLMKNSVMTNYFLTSSPEVADWRAGRPKCMPLCSKADSGRALLSCGSGILRGMETEISKERYYLVEQQHRGHISGQQNPVVNLHGEQMAYVAPCGI